MFEFAEYDLNIKYRKGVKAVVLDAINRRLNFIGKNKVNVAQLNVLRDGTDL